MINELIKIINLILFQVPVKMVSVMEKLAEFYQHVFKDIAGNSLIIRMCFRLH